MSATLVESESGYSRDEVRRAWRLVTWAGLLGSIYYILCVVGAPRIKYLTELGATALDFGLIAGLGSFALVFQILGSFLTNRLWHRKPLWICLAIGHRLFIIGVLLAPLLFAETRWCIAWIILMLFLHDAMAQTSVPLWLSWMTDLLPHESQTRHWAVRQRTITACNIIVMVLLALGFHWFEVNNRVIEGFVLVAVAGIILGVIDILMFKWVPEPRNERMDKVPLVETLVQPIRDKTFRRFLYFMGYFHFTAFMAAPFFNLYLIDSMGMDVRTVQLLGTCAALGVVVAARYWGLLCDAYGFRPMLIILAMGKMLSPLPYVLAPRISEIAIPFLAVTNFFDGVLNSGMMLAMQGMLLKRTPRRNRAMYIASTNFLAAGVMAGIAPIIAGKLIDVLNQLPSIEWGVYVFTGYHAAFLMSSMLRSGAVVLATRLREVGSIPARVAFRQMLSPRTLRAGRLVYRLHEARGEQARVESARRLGRLGSPVAVGELISALDDPSLAVRRAAAEALGRIGGSEATTPLAQALINPRSGIHSPAARALGRIGGFDSLKALIDNLQSQDRPALSETIESLVQIGDDSAILPLICLFHEIEGEDLRQQIAHALQNLSGGEHTMEEVLELLRYRRPPGVRVIR